MVSLRLSVSRATVMTGSEQDLERATTFGRESTVTSWTVAASYSPPKEDQRDHITGMKI